jgi:hypothetical protein
MFTVSYLASRGPQDKPGQSKKPRLHGLSVHAPFSATKYSPERWSLSWGTNSNCSQEHSRPFRGHLTPFLRNTPPGPGSRNARRILQRLGSMMCLTKVAITGIEIAFRGHHLQGSGRTPRFRASTRYERGHWGLGTGSGAAGGGETKRQRDRMNESAGSAGSATVERGRGGRGLYHYAKPRLYCSTMQVSGTFTVENSSLQRPF